MNRGRRLGILATPLAVSVKIAAFRYDPHVSWMAARILGYRTRDLVGIRQHAAQRIILSKPGHALRRALSP